ncbi:response regulator [Frigoriglobus tundricola]|uniref:histidine kinase n=1 Tax=Frigoriglobus tundricola TaxID=2774151 RepID=A0A6M5Z0Z3_9BACT|nr:response regulator [Frigoriglobus tundricola]QJW99071.1 Chemotaxis protein methyltransferase CheR [Frigoriglobus tundricola]
MSTPAQPAVHFLLVDDLEENLVALEALLRRDGLVVLKARSGPAALELLLTHEIALAFVDVQMPDMDGFELAELMRGTERTRRVPIIFLTAGTLDQQRRFRGYEAGAVDFLAKPIEAHVLRSKADVFFELWRERQEVARQRDELKAATAENARLLAETRRTADALREADQRKNEFLATLAHELRNPLAPLLNGLQILALSQTPEAAVRARAMMERQLRHMVRLVDDLLDISRVTSGKVRLRPEALDLRTAVEAAVEASRPAIEAGGHALTVRLPDEPMWLHADPTRIAQVIGNLLTNAAKYTPNGGRIAVSADRAPGHAVVRVADSGVGIPPDMLPQVFELFTQIGKHLDRAQGGLGIGLALVKRLVEMHGGVVTAESPGPDRGSTFSVRLPLAPEAPRPAAPNGTARTVRGQSRRVLVVDDNADAAESLSELLALSGHETETAESGPDALVAATRFQPELVFLDIGLPGMNGYEVARALRAEPGRTGVVLVALTGWGAEEDRRRSAEAGFDFHLTKPVEVGQLDALLAKLKSGGAMG